MFDQEARLDRLLARHRDVSVVTSAHGGPTLIRRDQLLVADHDLPVVADMVRRWSDSSDDHVTLTRIRLRGPARVDVCELAAQLSGEGRHRRLSVAPNHLVHGQPLWWSGPADLPRAAAPVEAPRAADAAAPVTVAVLDTGLSAHPWYESRDWYREQREEVTELLDADLDYQLDAQAGHGTFIAGIVLQRAPAARIRAKRVIGGDGVGDELGMIRALNWLARWGRADIVNLSIGCHTYDDRPSPLVARAIAALRSGGDGGDGGPPRRRTVVVACAGNAASDRPFWPAALKTVIAVAALDGADRAWFSGYGWWVDACTQGVGLTSCFVRFDGPRPRVNGVDPDRFAGYATWSGTSFAAPAVAGVIAGLAAAEGLSATAAADRILDPAGGPVHPDLGVHVRT
ncbi:S8 family peptidase [Actinomadura scrupuli]|uniref:S8 family peptidase n=1 Tax=Actinomadura scrupuli TaxID=559629 RepID=UPI003D96CBD3